MTHRPTRHDDHAKHLELHQELRLVSADPTIIALERSLHELAAGDRARLSGEALATMGDTAMFEARRAMHAQSHQDARPGDLARAHAPSPRRLPYAMAAMLTLGAMGTLAALLAQRTPGTSSTPRLAHRATITATPQVVPTDVEWDLVESVLALANTSKDSPSDVWNDAQALQQQWGEGSWDDAGSADSSS